MQKNLSLKQRLLDEKDEKEDQYRTGILKTMKESNSIQLDCKHFFLFIFLIYVSVLFFLVLILDSGQ
jgi:hypothetical protein